MEDLACLCWARAAARDMLARLCKQASGRAPWRVIKCCAFTPLHSSVSLYDFDCLTVGRLYSETQPSGLWFMRGRSDRRLQREKRKISMPKHTHTVMHEIRTNYMSLTPFIILVTLEWKRTAACISPMNQKSERRVWMNWNSCTLTHGNHTASNTSDMFQILRASVTCKLPRELIPCWLSCSQPDKSRILQYTAAF